MKNAIVSLSLMLLASTCFAQYSRPYRVAYNPDKKSYLVTNRGDGKVLELDSNYRLNTVVTGLTDPRDLVVGTVGGNKGLLVIDNNQIVVYDASGYNKIIAFNIAKLSWSEYEDIEMDPRDPRYFYLSDVGAGRIIKGKVGPPPFYTPTYTTLVSSGLNRPRGLLFNAKNELLVVTDDSAAKVVKIDTASGKLTTVFTPGVDSLNSITQDNEGNYFITNWEDSYLYRCDKDFKNLTKLTVYNKPAGMVVNSQTDLLIVLCYFCNKMEFHKLHYVEPTTGSGACPGDSFSVDVSITAEGVGTYNTGNAFEVELSDASGSFNKSTMIGKVTTTDKPKAIKCLMPSNAKGSKYALRIKSTSPQWYSSEQAVSVFDQPDVSTVVSNWSLCKGSTISIGRDSASDETYRWSNGQLLSDSTIAKPSFTANDTGVYQFKLTATNVVYQCVSTADVSIAVNPDIQLTGLKRLVDVCKGDSTNIGVMSSPYSFTWTPSVGLTASDTSFPKFTGLSSTKYQVRVEDLSTGCKGADSVEVLVHDLPQILVSNQSTSLCAGESAQLQVGGDTGLVYLWQPVVGLSDSTISNPVFTSPNAGDYTYTVTATNNHECSNNTQLSVSNNALPTGSISEISGAGNQTEGNEVYVKGDMAGSTSFKLFLITEEGAVVEVETFTSLPVEGYKLKNEWIDSNFVKGFVQFVSDSGCTSYSDTLIMPWLSVKKVFLTAINVYPNPTKGLVNIKSGGVYVKSFQVASPTGVVLFDLVNPYPMPTQQVDLSDYPDGLYILYFIDEYGMRYQQKVLKVE